MATSLTAALSTVVKEEIPRGIREQRIRMDPVWSEIISTSMGVLREGLGRDWKFLMTYESGIAGAYQFESSAVLLGPDLGFSNPAVSQFGAPNTWPGRTETTAPAFHQSTVTLKEARGNIFVPIKWLQMDEFDASIGSAVRSLMRGASRKAALAHAMAFYTTDAADFRVVYDLTAESAAAEHSITIANSTAGNFNHGRIQMIHNGQLLDIYGSDDVRDNTDSTWVCTDVNYLGNTFNLTKITGTNVALPAGGYLTLRNSRGNQPNGLNSWMKDASAGSQTVLGIDLDEHPEFGSLLVTESGPLTEKILNKHTGTFYDRIGTMCDIDTQISSAGVVHSYLENEDNLAWYERNGRRLDVKAGWTDIGYAYQGNAMRWAISSFVEAKTCFAIKLGGNNIKEYVPPATPGSGKKSEFDNEIQFVVQLGGATGVFLHERVVSGSNSNVGDSLEAPFFRICELAPDQVQGIKIDGLDESETN